MVVKMDPKNGPKNDTYKIKNAQESPNSIYIK